MVLIFFMNTIAKPHVKRLTEMILTSPDTRINLDRTQRLWLLISD